MRCPRLLRQLSDGRIGVDDFSIGIHKAILNSAIEVLRVSGGTVPECGITYDAIMNPLRAMISVGSIVSAEVAPLIEDLQYIYTMELQVEYYENAMASFLVEVRSYRQLTAPNVLNNPESLATALTSIVENARIGRPVVSNPFLDIQIGDYEEPIPSGLMCIDAPMRGGLGRKRSGIICGFTGIGKTAIGLQFSLGAARLGFRSRFATLELPLNEINQRAYANAAQYDYNLIQYGFQSQAASEEERSAEKEYHRLRIQEEIVAGVNTHMGASIHNFGIYDFSGKTCTVSSLEQMIVDDITAGNPIDVLIVDWLELVDLPVQNQSLNKSQQVLNIPIKELRHKLEKVTMELSKLGVKYNLAMWILTQADFKAENQSIIGLSNKSEGKGVSRHVSWFLGFGMSEEDERNNICYCHAGKGRNGRVFTSRVRRMLHQQRFESMENADEEEARENQQISLAGFS